MLSRFHGLLLLICLGMLSACSGIKIYPNDQPKNLVIKTETDSGLFFSSVKASLDIYDVTSACKLEYIGTVKLDRPTVEVGIEPGRSSYLSFRFTSSGFWSNSSNNISYETLIKPRRQYQYNSKVRYKNNIYNVKIVEKRSGKSRGKELITRHLRQCKQL
jgi:hypothetical protein